MKHYMYYKTKENAFVIYIHVFPLDYLLRIIQSIIYIYFTTDFKISVFRSPRLLLWEKVWPEAGLWKPHLFKGVSPGH